MPDCYDVIVIGAGLGGLTAAADNSPRRAEKRFWSNATTASVEQHRLTNRETSLSRLLFTKLAILKIPTTPNTTFLPALVCWTRSSGFRLLPSTRFAADPWVNRSYCRRDLRKRRPRSSIVFHQRAPASLPYWER